MNANWRGNSGKRERERQTYNTIYLIRLQVPANSIIVLGYGWRKGRGRCVRRDLRIGSSCSLVARKR